MKEDSDSVQAEELLGDRHAAEGRWAEALACFEKGVREDPAATSVVLKYHSAAVRLAQFGRAESVFRAACQGHPLNRRLRFLLIDTLLRQETYGPAMAEIESAMADFGIDDGILAAALNVRSRLGTRVRRDGVSLCMIVKNEEENLPRCLRSAKPLVDEIIIVDTGSTDRSKEVARAFGARVFDHVWDHDFANARNGALRQASGDWILILDADEVISAQDYERFRELLDPGSGPPAAYSIQTRNYTFQINTVGWRPNNGDYIREEAGAGWFPSEKVRLFPNDRRVHFSYAIHEVVEPSLRQASLPVRKAAIPVHHYGKLNADRTRCKTQSYSEIERRKLIETADEPAALRELAIQAAQLGNHGESIDLWSRFLTRRPDSAEAYVNQGASFWHLGRHDDAARCAERAVGLAPEMKEAGFNLAMAELHRGRAPRALAVIEPLLRRHPAYLNARFLLSAVHGCLADYERFRSAIEALGATVFGPVLSVAFLDLGQRLLSAGQTDYCRRLLAAAVQGGFSDSELSGWFEEHFGSPSK
jgi:Flp pilus assembly protein TadD